jgi:hypothetical protein
MSPHGTQPQDDDQHITLLTYLHDRDEPCPACKYNLRNLTSSNCPECGNALRVGITLADPYLKAWIALIIALLPPASFGALYIGIFGYILIRGRNFSLHDMFRGVPVSLFVIMTHLILSVPLVIAAIAMRRRFMRLQRPRQRLLAGLAWASWVLTISCIITLLNSPW